MNTRMINLGIAGLLFGIGQSAFAQSVYYSSSPIYSSPGTPIYYSPSVTSSGYVTSGGYSTPVVTIGRPVNMSNPTYVPWQNNGYVAPVTSLRSESGTYSSGPIYSPHIAPTFANGYSQRIRTVTSDGQFHNRYYNPQGQWMGSNSYGGPGITNQMYSTANQNVRRQQWGSDTTPARTTTNTSRRSSSRASYQQLSAFTWNMINRNNAMYNQRSQQSTPSYTPSSNSSSDSSSSGIVSLPSLQLPSVGSGSGTQSIIYDDNQPGK